MSDSIIENAIEGVKAAKLSLVPSLPNDSVGGGGGVDEIPAPMMSDPVVDPGPDPKNQEIQRAAHRMRDITTVASKMLEAYITSGGTYTSLANGHIEKAYQIASDFVGLGEAIWDNTIRSIVNGPDEASKRENSVIIP